MKKNKGIEAKLSYLGIWKEVPKYTIWQITPSRKKGVLLSTVIPVLLFYFLNYECMIFWNKTNLKKKKTFSKRSNKNNNSHYFPSTYYLRETYLILYTNLSLFLRPALQSKIIPILQMKKLKIRMNKNIFNCFFCLCFV